MLILEVVIINLHVLADHINLYDMPPCIMQRLKPLGLVQRLHPISQLGVVRARRRTAIKLAKLRTAIISQNFTARYYAIHGASSQRINPTETTPSMHSRYCSDRYKSCCTTSELGTWRLKSSAPACTPRHSLPRQAIYPE